MNQQALRDIGVDNALITRVIAVFGSNIPQPPAKMMMDSGQYEAINEFYAMKLVMAMGDRLNVRNVKKLVTGSMAKVARNYKELKEALPEAFTPAPKDKTGDAMSQLKRELVAQERAVFDIEIEELDAKHTAEIVQLEQAHESTIRKLETELTKAHKENAVIADLLKSSQLHNEDLIAKLKHEAVNANELRNIQLVAQERKESLDETRKVIEILKGQFDHFKNKTDERIEILERDKKRAQTAEQVALRTIEEHQTVIDRYVSEAENLSSQITELKQELNIRAINYTHEESNAVFVHSIQAAITPLEQLNEMIQIFAAASQQKAIDMSTVTSLITDVSTNLLNFKASIELSLQDIKNSQMNSETVAK